MHSVASQTSLRAGRYGQLADFKRLRIAHCLHELPAHTSTCAQVLRGRPPLHERPIAMPYYRGALTRHASPLRITFRSFVRKRSVLRRGECRSEIYRNSIASLREVVSISPPCVYTTGATSSSQWTRQLGSHDTSVEGVPALNDVSGKSGPAHLPFVYSGTNTMKKGLTHENYRITKRIYQRIE